MSIPNNVLYWSGTMLDMAPNLDTQLQDTASSGRVADSSVFIVPGYAANNKADDGPGICPDDFTSTLSPDKGKGGGAFVWNSQHIFDDPAPCNGNTASVNDYAAAITKALQ